jgi:protein SDA1
MLYSVDVTKVLVYLAQSCHDLVPPDIVMPCVRAITDNFITERNAPEVMAVGLNTVREISVRCPLVMTRELLDDLTAYKSHRDRSVVMAARSLIQAFRLVNPQLLHKKDRGRPTDVEQGKPMEYGEVRPAEFVPGMEVRMCT